MSSAGAAQLLIGYIECDETLANDWRLRLPLRKKLADERNVPAYIIFSDVSLRQMARYYPANEVEFARISGVGERKLAEFGSRFIAEIAAHRRANPTQSKKSSAKERVILQISLNELAQSGVHAAFRNAISPAVLRAGTGAGNLKPSFKASPSGFLFTVAPIVRHEGSGMGGKLRVGKQKEHLVIHRWSFERIRRFSA